MSVIGEHGPELIDLPAGSVIVGSDILTRVFGPDPNPAGTLPTLPYRGGPSCATGEHDWSSGVRSGIPYWVCVVCDVMSSEPPEPT